MVSKMIMKSGIWFARGGGNGRRTAKSQRISRNVPKGVLRVGIHFIPFKGGYGRMRSKDESVNWGEGLV